MNPAVAASKRTRNPFGFIGTMCRPSQSKWRIRDEFQALTRPHGERSHSIGTILQVSRPTSLSTWHGCCPECSANVQNGVALWVSCGGAEEAGGRVGIPQKAADLAALHKPPASGHKQSFLLLSHRA